MFRYVAYANFATAINFSGKPVFNKIKKPSDLFKVASVDHQDNSNDKVLTGDAANNFMKQIVKK